MSYNIFCWKCGNTKYSVDKKILEGTCLHFGRFEPHQWVLMVDSVRDAIEKHKFSLNATDLFEGDVIKVNDLLKELGLDK